MVIVVIVDMELGVAVMELGVAVMEAIVELDMEPDITGIMITLDGI